MVVIIKDPESLDEANGMSVNVLQLLPSLDNHALFVLDKDYVLKDFDVHIFVVLVQLTLVLDHKVRVGKVH